MSRARVNPRAPEALAICDRCGFRFSLNDLNWQMQWNGVRIQNLRLLVCPTCLDKPQEQLRTFILPPDPVPVKNPRPENYPGVDNPMSAFGGPVAADRSQFSAQMGSLENAGGTYAAFDGNPYKPNFLSAQKIVSDSSYDNWAGINWTGYVTGTPSDLNPGTVTHVLSSYTVYAPLDTTFLGSTRATDYVVQGSTSGSSDWADWTTLSSGVTTGSAGESISGTSTNATGYGYHRIAFLGDGSNTLAVAQVQFSVADVGQYSS